MPPRKTGRSSRRVGPSGTPDDGYGSSPSWTPTERGWGPDDRAGHHLRRRRAVVLRRGLDYAHSPKGTGSTATGDPLWTRRPSRADTTRSCTCSYASRRSRRSRIRRCSTSRSAGPTRRSGTRIVAARRRGRTDATDAAGALATSSGLGRSGLAFDPGTMRLRSQATLQVGFVRETRAGEPVRAFGPGRLRRRREPADPRAGRKRRETARQRSSGGTTTPTSCTGSPARQRGRRTTTLTLAAPRWTATTSRRTDRRSRCSSCGDAELVGHDRLRRSDNRHRHAVTTPYNPTAGQVQLATGTDRRADGQPAAVPACLAGHDRYASGPFRWVDEASR